jgi:hypothetical protein
MGGEGCDYTIGCGMRYDIVEEETIEDVVERAAFPDGRNEGSALEGEMALTEILIAPLEHVFAVDVLMAKAEKRELDKIKLSKEKEDIEQKEFERLKAKYGE